MNKHELLKEYEEEMIKIAMKTRLEKSFSPISGSKVGISVLTSDGKIYSGANVEFARSMNIHGEFMTIADVCQNYILPKYENDRNKYAEKLRKGFDEIVAMAEVNSGGIPGCGPCRQLVLETNPNMIFYGVYPDGKIKTKLPIKQLYPNSYRSNDNFKL